MKRKYIKTLNEYNSNTEYISHMSIYKDLEEYETNDARVCQSCPEVGIENEYDCHSITDLAAGLLKNKEYYKDLEFFFWDEENWDDVTEQMKKDDISFENETVSRLYNDIKDGYTNGHSFLKYKDHYIDFYLYDLNVPDQYIQEFCGYFSKFITPWTPQEK